MTEMTLFRGVLQARRFCLLQQIDAECNRILRIDDNEPSFSEYASDDESEGEGPAASWWGEGDGWNELSFIDEDSVWDALFQKIHPPTTLCFCIH